MGKDNMANFFGSSQAALPPDEVAVIALVTAEKSHEHALQPRTN